MNMKSVFLTFIGAVISISAISQNIEYRKDNRPQNIKEDRFNEYQVNRISDIDILKALEIVGVRIFDIPISPAFEKEYKLSVIIDEYVKGKKIDSQNVTFNYAGKNTYHYYIDGVPYFDYFPKFTVFTQDNDKAQRLHVTHYGGSSRKILKNRIRRKGQFYTWRAYSKTDWELNEEVPLLVYASSWYDKRIKLDRFCGVVDLSLDEERTKELFDNSPHYYVISLKISE